MGAASDKLYEAKYNFRRMREEVILIPQESGATHIHRFRFHTNAFVNAARSVTFIIQKQYRGLHGGNFDDWYAKQQAQLSQQKVFVELRNVIQKEGNRLPLFKSKSIAPDGNILHYTWDYSGEGQKQMKAFTLILSEKYEIGRTISDEMDFEKFIKEGIQRVETIILNSKGPLVKLERSLIIDDKGTEVTFEEFLDMCNQYLNILEQIVDEGERLFSAHQEK